MPKQPIITQHPIESFLSKDPSPVVPQNLEQPAKHKNLFKPAPSKHIPISSLYMPEVPLFEKTRPFQPEIEKKQEEFSQQKKKRILLPTNNVYPKVQIAPLPPKNFSPLHFEESPKRISTTLSSNLPPPKALQTPKSPRLVADIHLAEENKHPLPQQRHLIVPKKTPFIKESQSTVKDVGNIPLKWTKLHAPYLSAAQIAKIFFEENCPKDQDSSRFFFSSENSKRKNQNFFPNPFSLKKETHSHFQKILCEKCNQNLKANMKQLISKKDSEKNKDPLEQDTEIPEQKDFHAQPSPFKAEEPLEQDTEIPKQEDFHAKSPFFDIQGLRFANNYSSQMDIFERLYNVFWGFDETKSETSSPDHIEENPEDITDLFNHIPYNIRTSPAYQLEEINPSSLTRMGTIGLGRESKIYLVKDPNGKSYAMKEPKDMFEKYAEKEYEIQKLARRGNPYIISPLHLKKKDKKPPQIIFQYVKKSLENLSESVDLSEDEIKFYIAELVVALEDIHKKHIYHGDLTLDNIRIENGHVLIGDFGNAEAPYMGYSPRYYDRIKNEKPSKRLLKELEVMDIIFLGGVVYQMFTKKDFPEDVWPDSISHYLLNGQENTETLELPSEMSKLAVDFIKACRSKRALEMTDGNLKAHPWLKDIDWKSFEEKKIVPPYV
eukprot:GHVN01016672.1.p1 GENE.GHVN01016672.1~~GHVN01016672.1.p1  ORF type:complete len:728 (+),score=70.09 GHVN01016672.1:202-2184(+)